VISYRVAGLIEQHGRDAAIVDWLDKIAADLCLLKEEISQCALSGCDPTPSRLFGFPLPQGDAISRI